MPRVQVAEITIMFGALVPGCATTSIRHLDARAFEEKVAVVEQMGSAVWANYVGATDGRVYIEHQSLVTLSGEPRTVIYWTERDGLPAEVLERLETARRKGLDPGRKLHGGWR